jgi:hypothetical protein
VNTGSIDEAESAAAQHARDKLGKKELTLKWKRGYIYEDRFLIAKADMPVWGRGHFAVPPKQTHWWDRGNWHGDDAWGQPFRSMSIGKKGIEEFVRQWVKLMEKGKHYYRVVPFRPGDERFPPGAARQEAVADLVEHAERVSGKAWEDRTQIERALWQAERNATEPEFKWEVKQRKRKLALEPAGGTLDLVMYRGQHEIGQVYGYFEVLEYTTGKKPKVRSLGVFRVVPERKWRKDFTLKPSLVDVAWARPAVAQMVLGAPAEVVTTSGYPNGVSEEGTVEELAGRLIGLMVAELALAKALETGAKKKIEKATGARDRARMMGRGTMDEIVTTFGGARAEKIRQEAQARMEAWLQDNLEDLMHFWPAREVEARRDKRVQVRGLMFGNLATQAELHEMATEKIREYAKKKDLPVSLQELAELDFEDDGIRFLAELPIHEPRDELRQMRIGSLEFRPSA